MRKFILFLILFLCFINITYASHDYVMPIVLTNSTTNSTTINDSNIETGIYIGELYIPFGDTYPNIYVIVDFNIINDVNKSYYLQSYHLGGDFMFMSYYNYTSSEYDSRIDLVGFDSDDEWENISINKNYINNSNLTIKYTNDKYGAIGAYSKLTESKIFVETHPTIPISYTNLSNNLINHTPTISWTKGTDSDEDIVKTYIYVGTNSTPTKEEGNTTLETFQLGNNILLTDGNTYYYRLRSYDGYEYSNYTTADEFRMNSEPIITNVTISPDPIAVEDDLTAFNDTATDTESDTITLYYRWYKDSILQSDLTTSIVNSTNTSNGEFWKVGIIPNDGYENGTEVQSQTVEIGSNNSAPTLTGVNIDKTYPLKRYVNFTITSENASDPNNDPRKLEVGSAIGLSDLGIGEYVTNGNESNITITMPFYDGLEHTLYIRLNDSNLTSQEYTLTIESDITKPVLNSESLSTSSTTQGLPVGITINTTSVNSTIKTVTVNVARPDATSANWTLTNTVNDIWYYNYIATSDLGTYTINYFTITDASDNIKTASSSLSFTITAAAVTPGGGGGGGGGSTTIIVNGTIGDLTITPPTLDTYVLYGGFGEDRMLKYRFITNREVISCLVEPSEGHGDIATCNITDGYIVDVYLTINDSKGYSGTLTVRDSEEFVTTSDLIVRVIDIGAYIKIVNIPVGEAIASILNPFFASANGVLIGIRAWIIGAIIGVLGLSLFKSDIFE